MTSITLLFLMGLILGLTPIEPGADKDYYMQEFLGLTSERSNEVGWLLYSEIQHLLIGYNYIFFFIITAILYVFSYYFLARKLFSPEMAGYFVIMSVGALGFANYGNNTIRAGFSIALIFYAVSLNLKKWQSVFIIILALLTHKSMIIPLLCFFISKYLREKKTAELIWLFCLVFSIISVNLDSIFEEIGFLDERIEQFTSGAIDQTDEYGARFRFDFLIYSIIPLYIANIWMRRYQYENEFYLSIYKTYLLGNSIWLLVMRMPFCDRIAYLSWFLIPIITLYPLLTYGIPQKNIQRVLAFIMAVFVVLNVLLSFR